MKAIQLAAKTVNNDATLLPNITLKLAVKVALPIWRDLYAGPDDIDQIVNGQTDADQRWMVSMMYEFGD